LVQIQCESDDLATRAPETFAYGLAGLAWGNGGPGGARRCCRDDLSARRLRRCAAPRGPASAHGSAAAISDGRAIPSREVALPRLLIRQLRLRGVALPHHLVRQPRPRSFRLFLLDLAIPRPRPLREEGAGCKGTSLGVLHGCW
ncbi:unnamed protein product, partial [Urochloa humidicola]